MISAVFLSSCNLTSIEDRERYHYYKFNSDDESWLISSLKEDDRLTYINPKTNEKFKLKVSYLKVSYREEYTIGMGFFTTYASKYFEYDKQTIVLRGIDEPYIGEIQYSIRKFPVTGDDVYRKAQVSSKVPKQPENLFIQIDLPQWNGIDTTNAIGFPNTNAPVPARVVSRDILFTKDICCVQTVTLGDKIYDDVLVITSNNTQPFQPCNGCVIYKINKCFYSKSKGIVGWENLDGERWIIE